MCDHDEVLHLRAILRAVTDDFAQLLEDGKFPNRGRRQDDRDSWEGWWEDRVARIRRSYATLAGVSDIAWTDAHPGLYIPPAGEIKL